MNNFSSWRMAWALLDSRERKQAALILVLVMLSAGLEVIMVGSVLPFLAVLSDPTVINDQGALSWAFEKFGFSSEYDFVITLGLASIGVILATNAVLLLRSYVMIRFATMRQHGLSTKLLETYLAQPYVFFLNRHTGDMARKVLDEAGQVANGFFAPASKLVASFFTVILLVGLLLLVNPLVAATAFLVFGGIYWLTYRISRIFVSRLGRERVEANSKKYRLANEALGGVKDIKILGREGSYIDRFHSPSLQIAKGTAAMRTISEFPGYVIKAVMFSSILGFCLILIDVSDFQSGQPLGGLLPLIGVFAFAGQRLMPALTQAYSSLTAIQYAAAAVENVYSDLKYRRTLPSTQDTLESGLVIGKSLSFRNISFAYPGAISAGLKDVTIEIVKGHRIGIVGSTGAGKTTLADIALGLLRPDSGSLFVDDVQITDANLRAWQRNVGYVPQDIFLGDASIIENIALGTPNEEIDIEHVRWCARQAVLDDFVSQELPEGYASKVGERGVRLSGGQKQRIGIARALYHNADLIVFDEATSALDNATEREVMSAIDALPGDKTVLIIAHRLSTVRRTDRIIVLDQGRVVGFGKWEDLAKSNEAFMTLTRSAMVA